MLSAGGVRKRWLPSAQHARESDHDLAPAIHVGANGAPLLLDSGLRGRISAAAALLRQLGAARLRF